MMTQQKPSRSWKALSRIAAQVMIDVVLINLSMLFAVYVYEDFHLRMWVLARFAQLWPLMTLLCLGGFFVMRVYRSLWKYAGLSDGLRVAIGALMGVGLTWLLGETTLWLRAAIAAGALPQWNIPYLLMPRPAYITMYLVLTVLEMLSRFSVRIANQVGVSSRALSPDRRTRVMIIGAGWGGAQIIRQLTARGFREGMPVVLVDDDPSKSGTSIGSTPVVYGVENIPAIADQYAVDEIIIAIPSATPARLKEIMDACTETNCKLKMVPGLRDVTGGELNMGEIRDVNIADLLFRDEVDLDMASISSYLAGKTVLVTGGGGSIGSELCRQIMVFKPARLVIFEIYENNAFDLLGELKEKYGDEIDVRVLIGSVRDPHRLEEVFTAHRPDVVFHAAAHKHVPLVEVSPAEAVKNNIFGTLNVAMCADKFGVERMVSLSTDKAVNPANIMGATKRITEMVLQYMAKRSKTRYMAVRFGNVLGSNGSVVPIFLRQIKAGGPVRLTHADMTRYFMTIPEASRLVLQAGAIGVTGNIFVLDMGTPVLIMDLAKNLIRLSGYRPGEDIKIEVVGLRPGEKLYEELMMKEEQDTLEKTSNEKIFVLHPPELDEAVFEKALGELRLAADQNQAAVRPLLHRIVPTFKENELAPVVDELEGTA